MKMTPPPTARWLVGLVAHPASEAAASLHLARARVPRQCDRWKANPAADAPQTVEELLGVNVILKPPCVFH
jgi:hypothetical protein